MSHELDSQRGEVAPYEQSALDFGQCLRATLAEASRIMGSFDAGHFEASELPLQLELCAAVGELVQAAMRVHKAVELFGLAARENAHG